MHNIDHNTATLLSRLIEDEAEAIKGYEEVLRDACLYEKDVEIISEIIQDEVNHILLLLSRLRCYNGDLPPASDGMKEALKEIKKGMKDD